MSLVLCVMFGVVRYCVVMYDVDICGVCVVVGYAAVDVGLRL